MSDERTPLKLSELSGDRDERGLICKKCGCRHFNVKHTRPAPSSIMRERQCRHCGKVVWTREKMG
jgi:hypothetical protein